VKRTAILVAAAALALGACAGETPEQKHEVGCMAGTFGGALVGGALGSLIGSGGGRALATAAGAGVGTFAGNRLACE
jgi:uncharacterized protein YcfJ